MAQRSERAAVVSLDSFMQDLQTKSKKVRRCKLVVGPEMEKVNGVASSTSGSVMQPKWEWLSGSWLDSRVVSEGSVRRLAEMANELVYEDPGQFSLQWWDVDFFSELRLPPTFCASRGNVWYREDLKTSQLFRLRWQLHARVFVATTWLWDTAGVEVPTSLANAFLSYCRFQHYARPGTCVLEVQSRVRTAEEVGVKVGRMRRKIAFTGGE